jgi:hypothetical protein
MTSPQNRNRARGCVSDPAPRGEAGAARLAVVQVDRFITTRRIEFEQALPELCSGLNLPML